MVKYNEATLDRTFAALADPTRRKLLQRLSRGETRVTELARPFTMSLAAVSKHLVVLERAGLLQRRKQGREHQLQIQAAPMRDAARWMEEYRAFWEGSLDRLAAYLEDSTTTQTPKQKEKS
jgi:DNA-binding transcriptional ArsR family regulator